jgi:hypothetical protein
LEGQDEISYTRISSYPTLPELPIRFTVSISRFKTKRKKYPNEVEELSKSGTGFE